MKALATISSFLFTTTFLLSQPETWSSDKEYPYKSLVVVGEKTYIANGDSMQSGDKVPKGTLTSDTNYWVPIEDTLENTDANKSDTQKKKNRSEWE